MLHDKIGITKKEFDDFLKDLESHFLLSGGIWRHKERIKEKSEMASTSTSVVLDRFFAQSLKSSIQIRLPDNGAFSRKSIFELLEIHAPNKYALQVDIHNYFGSIRFETIAHSLSKIVELKSYQQEIKKLYFYDDSLRKGLIASPAISELVGLKIDNICKKTIYEHKFKGLKYSRYYDDLVFSSNNKTDLAKIHTIIEKLLPIELRLELNKNKTRLIHLDGSKILGLRFHNKQIVVSKVFKNKLRSLEYYYQVMDEDDVDPVTDKLSMVGTIIAMTRRILQNSSAGLDKYEESSNYYYDELGRLKELKRSYIEERERKGLPRR